MLALFQTIDRLLRGGLAKGGDAENRRIDLPMKTLLAAALVLGCIYGAFMGLYGVLRPDHRNFQQWIATTLKVPLLFLLTLFVTFPSLYVFSALADSRARFREMLRLLLAVITVTMALLASFGPITGFFTLSTESYGFMIVLNVAFFTIAGVIGLRVLREALARELGAESARPALIAAPARQEPLDGEDPATGSSRPPAVLARPAPARASASIFRIWLVIYAVVGAQMGWILRPFIGNPEEPFAWFRAPDSNFFAAFAGVLKRLLA
jgi:hypothetical protein